MAEIQLPNLDDTTENERLEQMKALIPRYTPEWTDHSMSEPGMGFLQLMVWLAGQIQYRLNQIPDKAYLSFLKMLGFELDDGEAATVDLQFTLTAAQSFDITIPAGTEVSTRQTETESAITFKTNEVLTIPAGSTTGTVSATCTQIGEVGNVGANTLIILNEPIPYVKSVTNPQAASGGIDAESLDSLKARAPTEIKIQDRAVADEDHATLAMRASEGVGRAWTLPLYDPAQPGQEIEGHTTVVIIPAGGGTASSELLNTVKSYLEKRRLTASRLHVISADLVEIAVQATVAKESGYTDAEVQQNVINALDAFLDEESWQAGRSVYVYEVASVIEQAAGVDHVESISYPTNTITLTKTQVTTPGSHNITIQTV